LKISTLFYTSFSIYYFNSFDFAGDSSETAQQVQVAAALHDNSLKIISPDLFKPFIEMLKTEILNQMQNNGPQNPKDFLKWITLSNLIDSQESDRLNQLLLDNKIEEFYSQIPRFLPYESQLTVEFLIVNNRIYVSETVAKFFMTQPQIDERLGRGDFIFQDKMPQLKPKIPMDPRISDAQDSVKNYLPYVAALKMALINIVSLLSGWASTTTAAFGKELAADQPAAAVTVATAAEAIKFIFYMNPSDLYNSTGDAAVLKAKVDTHNSSIVPMDKIQNSEIWDFYKTFYYSKIIERSPHHLINYHIFHRLPLNEVTIEKFFTSKFLQVYEFWEEEAFLQKASIGMEFLLCKNILSKSIFYTKYSLDDINEGKECLLRFWLRQIAYYHSLPNMADTEFHDYLPNMFDIETLQEELLENILYAQCMILEGFWTINFALDLISLKGSASAAAPLSEFNSEEQRMDFFNLIYEQYLNQILGKYREVYSIRREFIISRAIPCDLSYHL